MSDTYAFKHSMNVVFNGTLFELTLFGQLYHTGGSFMALPTRVVRGSDPFTSLHREFDNMLGQVFGGSEQTTGWANYAVDVREDGDHLYVDAELPGFKKEEVD